MHEPCAGALDTLLNGGAMRPDVEEPLELEREWPTPLFPLLLVNIGSGVSVLRVEGFKRTEDTRNGGGGGSSGSGGGGSGSGSSLRATGASSSRVNFRRVGGTACGGATFLGLAKLLTRRPDMSFDEALELASAGDSSYVDKLVGDIYGEEGSAALGLPASLTAASFGKLVAPPPPEERNGAPHERPSMGCVLPPSSPPPPRATQVQHCHRPLRMRTLAGHRMPPRLSSSDAPLLRATRRQVRPQRRPLRSHRHLPPPSPPPMGRIYSVSLPTRQERTHP